MALRTNSKVRAVITWVLRCVIGLIFLLVGVEKLTGTMGTIPFFDAIGWGQWLRYVSGAVDTAGALLVFFPRFTSLGAFMITCSVGLGTYLCYAKAVFNPAFPLVMTLLAATLIWLGWTSRTA
ncbi:DoxX family membrane protein [Silvibacterium dinghuense]|uniref:DoxX family membrane protein n=1 Tax=Silvibacterium dinghuense TaxID=1560006 RepID=A0A4V1NV55_9BACT|nr:DoxX family membrane protein [Silvibacterium dinghuense]RXS94582.1 DoxX family membrane protein [Silvibacterium dinghuense]